MRFCHYPNILREKENECTRRKLIIGIFGQEFDSPRLHQSSRLTDDMSGFYKIVILIKVIYKKKVFYQ